MITIRKFNKEDAPRVAELITQLTANINQPDNLIQRLKGMVEGVNYQYLVVEMEGLVVGFGGLAWYPIPSKGVLGWIEEVVVDNKVRGQGISKELMRELLKIAKSRHCQVIKLTTSNPIARALYESFGFQTKLESTLMHKKLN
jgi:N-acetylglutamate synthase-like GNAT family acetyltransferase